MNAQDPAPSAAPKSTRRRWIWITIAAVVCAPFVALAVAAYSFATLDRDAAVLRRQVMAATDARWTTKIQLSAGRATLAALRGCLTFVHHKDIEEARLALRAVRCASVGVYEMEDDNADWSREKLLNETDRRMEERGWMRIVGVSQDGDTVLVYAPADAGEPEEFCLAVVDGRQLVIVSAAVNAGALEQLVERHAGGEWKRPFRLAKI